MKPQDPTKRKRGKVRFDNGARYAITMTQSGIQVRQHRCRKVRTVTFGELIDLCDGQRHLRLT